MTAIRFLLAGVLAEMVGLALLTRLGRERRSGPGMLGTAFLTGVLGMGLVSHLFLWLRIPLTPTSVVVGSLVLLALGRWRRLGEAVWKRPPWPALILIPAAAFLLVGAVSWPSLGADPEFFYLFKAKSIARYGTFWNPDFFDPEVLHKAHRRVILLPILYVNLAFLCGGFNVILLRVWFALLQIAGWGAMYDAFRSRVPRNEAALGVALYACLPALWHDAGGAMTGYADAPLATILILVLTSEKPMAAFLLTAGVLIKDDAMPFVIPFAVVRGFLPALFPAIAAAAWMVTSSCFPMDADYCPQYFLYPKLVQIPFILRTLGGEWISLKHWSILWVAILLVLCFHARSLRRQDAWLLFPVTFQLGVYTFVWMSFPVESGRFLIRVEDMRLLLHVTPILWLWTVWKGSRLVCATGSSPEVMPVTRL